MVEILLRQRLDQSKFDVRSAGTFGWPGAPVNSMVVLELARLGASAEGFSSHALTTDDVEWANLVLTASREHRAHVLERHPDALRRTFTLREFATLVGDSVVPSLDELVRDAYLRRSEAAGDVDIDDPFRQPPAVHRVVADQIAEAVDEVAEALERAAR
jgi:protein-tyrosine phosphatase